MTARDLANFIRPLKEAARRPPRSRTVAAVDERVVRALATREHVERRVVARLKALADFTPELHLATLLSDGAWVWSLRGFVPSRSPRPRRPMSFCRLDLGLRLNSATGRFVLESHATVHDADLESLRWESPIVGADWDALGAWIEEAALAFAAAYFGGRSSS
ncbi:MAG TPA: hypothetical protein VFY71_10190 [Planctomycetota bacterium]|nr:hypothetical protein [Planctomycetota bacterium]